MNRSQIVEILLSRGALPCRIASVPEVGGAATTEFFSNFESFTGLLGGGWMNGYPADTFSETLLAPKQTDLYVVEYEGAADVSSVRRFAADISCLLIDAADPGGQLFAEHEANQVGVVAARATGVLLWDWLRRLAELLLASPDARLNNPDGELVPGCGFYDAGVWFTDTWSVLANLDLADLELAIVGGGRFERDLPKAKDSAWWARSFAGLPGWVQLKTLDALESATSSGSTLASAHIDAIRSAVAGLVASSSEEQPSHEVVSRLSEL